MRYGPALLGAACTLAACHSRTPAPRAPTAAHSAAAPVTIPPPPARPPADAAGAGGSGPTDAGSAPPEGGGAEDGGAAEASTGAAAPHPQSNIEIELHRTACFGTCPIYTLQLYGNGTVVFNGKGHTVLGVHVAHVAPSKVQNLAHALQRAGFFTLSWNKHCGKGYATDNPSAITTLRIGSRKRTINHYHGDMCAPGVLDGWEQRIDKVAGTSRWLGPP